MGWRGGLAAPAGTAAPGRGVSTRRTARVGRLRAAASALLALALRIAPDPDGARVGDDRPRTHRSQRRWRRRGDDAQPVPCLLHRAAWRNGARGGREHERSARCRSNAPSIDPASEPDGDTVYSPLSFLVGSDHPADVHDRTVRWRCERRVQRRSGRGRAKAGTEYSARAVLSAEASGEGVALTLSTNDPSGMQLEVTHQAPEHRERRRDPPLREPERTRRACRRWPTPSPRARRGVPRVRRTPRRARPARAGILQLGRPGERHGNPRTGLRGIPVPGRSRGRL